MNWGRFMKALSLRNIGEIEQLRLAQIKGLIKNEHITTRQWERIAENERLINVSS